MTTSVNKSRRRIVLRIVIILVGLFIGYTGSNIAFGGIVTLGLQGDTDFLQVVDYHAYSVQDSHIRFIGGLWLGIGLLFLIASLNLFKYLNVLRFSCMLVFFGGLIRFSQMDLAITLGPDIIGSLIAEVIGAPLLFLWLGKTMKQQASLLAQPM